MSVSRDLNRALDDLVWGEFPPQESGERRSTAELLRAFAKSQGGPPTYRLGPTTAVGFPPQRRGGRQSTVELLRAFAESQGGPPAYMPGPTTAVGFILQQIFARTQDRLRSRVEREFGEGIIGALGGNWWRALWLARFETRNRDLDILARAMARKWSASGVRRELRDLAEARRRPVETEKVEALRVGLMEASLHRLVPQTVRLGRAKWIRGDDGHKAVILPFRDLSWEQAVRWLATSARAAAEAHVKGTDWPTSAALTGRNAVAQPLDRDVLSLHDDAPAIISSHTEPGPDDALVASDELGHLVRTAAEADPAFLRLLCNHADLPPISGSSITLTKADVERAFLRCLFQAARLTPALQDLADAFLAVGEWPLAAQKLGISKGTMRERKRLLFRKLHQAASTDLTLRSSVSPPR